MENKIIPMLAFISVLLFLASTFLIPRMFKADVETETRFATMYIEDATCGSVAIDETAVTNYTTSISDITRDVTVEFTDKESYFNAKNYIGDICKVQFYAGYADGKFNTIKTL